MAEEDKEKSATKVAKKKVVKKKAVSYTHLTLPTTPHV